MRRFATEDLEVPPQHCWYSTGKICELLQLRWNALWFALGHCRVDDDSRKIFNGVLYIDGREFERLKQFVKELRVFRLVPILSPADMYGSEVRAEPDLLHKFAPPALSFDEELPFGN